MRFEVLTAVKMLMLVFYADLLALKMEAAYSSKTLVSIYKSHSFTTQKTIIDN
jgi:hypothetical protein